MSRRSDSRPASTSCSPARCCAREPQLRVTAQLVEVEGGTVLWSDRSTVTLGDIFQLQDDLTQAIVSSLKLQLTAREHRLLNLNVPTSARAYEWYLRASQLSLEATTWNAALELYTSGASPRIRSTRRRGRGSAACIA